MNNGEKKLTVIEENQIEFDEEDLQEKAMIGRMLHREYEKEISDTASNQMRSSKQNF